MAFSFSSPAANQVLAERASTWRQHATIQRDWRPGCSNRAPTEAPSRPRKPPPARFRRRVAGQDHERRGSCASRRPLGVDDARLAGDDAPPPADGAPFGADAACVLGDRAREIGLCLDCRIAAASGHQCVRCAAGRAVDKGERPAAVNDPQGIQKVRPGVALEDREAVADLREPERHGLRDCRGRQAPVDTPWRNSRPVICRTSADRRRRKRAQRCSASPLSYLCIYK